MTGVSLFLSGGHSDGGHRSERPRPLWARPQPAVVVAMAHTPIVPGRSPLVAGPSEERGVGVSKIRAYVCARTYAGRVAARRRGRGRGSSISATPMSPGGSAQAAGPFWWMWPVRADLPCGLFSPLGPIPADSRRIRASAHRGARRPHRGAPSLRTGPALSAALWGLLGSNRGRVGQSH